MSIHKHEKKLRQSVILSQIVMVGPGTHLEKYHESLSRTNESQFKNNEFLGLYVTTQLIWRQTPKLCITVCWNKNISFYYQAQQKLKQQPQETTTATRTATEITQTGYSRKTFYKNFFRSINQSLRPMGCIPQIILHLWEYLWARDAGRRGNKITGELTKWSMIFKQITFFY